MFSAAPAPQEKLLGTVGQDSIGPIYNAHGGGLNAQDKGDFTGPCRCGKTFKTKRAGITGPFKNRFSYSLLLPEKSLTSPIAQVEVSVIP